MRFVIVSLGYHPEVPGGAWRVAAEQAEGLAARGHEVAVVTAQPGEGTPLTEERRGVRLNRYRQVNRSFLANWLQENRAAAERIREEMRTFGGRALMVQHHAYLGPAVAAVRGPVAQVFHGPWAEEYRLAMTARRRSWGRRWRDGLVARVMHQVERRALRRASRVMVLSRHFARELVRWHGRRFEGAEVVPGGVDPARFRPMADREAIRGELGIGADEFLMVALRRLDPRMGLDLLLEAFSRVAGEFPRVRLRVVGEGPQREALEGMIGRWGLGSVAGLMGGVAESEVPRWLNAADLVLMPSRALEGFGLVTAEALACGTPVLGSSAGATVELLEPLSAGLLFEAGSVEGLAGRMREIFREPGALPTREACARYARGRFHWGAQVSWCERVAGELMKAGSE